MTILLLLLDFWFTSRMSDAEDGGAYRQLFFSPLR